MSAPQDCTGAGEPFGELIGREWSMLAFPLGDAAAARFEAESMSGGLGDPGADCVASRTAACSIASARSWGSEMDRFCRPAMHRW